MGDLEDFRPYGGSYATVPGARQRNHASSLNEQDALIGTYEHLTGQPDAADALHRLRKIASMVKPIMRKRGWQVKIFAEFLPEDARLLGLNVNKGYKICIRLRYPHRPSSFIPIEQCVDTMLHELSHIIHGPHDAKFHALWDELRDEHETLVMRGYTGEGFLTKGKRLGGGPAPPPHELRRLARQNAEDRRRLQKNGLPPGGVRLGGRRIHPGQDPRAVIADAIERRTTMDRGCASGTGQANDLASQPGQRTTMTRAEEDDANNRAIAEALLELMEEEETQKLQQAGNAPTQGLSWNARTGLTEIAAPPPAVSRSSEEDQLKWAIEESMKAMPGPSDERYALPLAGPSGPSTGDDEARSVKRARTASPAPTSSSTASTEPTAPADITRKEKAVEPPPNKPSQPADASNVIDMTNSSPPAPPSVRPAAADKSPLEPAPPARDAWPCDICTCINPQQYLACSACGAERSTAVTARPAAQQQRQSGDGGSRNGVLDRSARANLERVRVQAERLHRPRSMGWGCRRCGTFMEHRYWTCSACGLMKGDSRASEHVG